MFYVKFSLNFNTRDHKIRKAVIVTGSIKYMIINNRLLHFAACSRSFYGKNCMEQCSKNCNETTSCDRVTGGCEGGCEPGWTGITCNDGEN